MRTTKISNLGVRLLMSTGNLTNTYSYFNTKPSAGFLNESM